MNDGVEINALAAELRELIENPKEDTRRWSWPYYRSDKIKLLLAREFGRRNGWQLSERWFAWGQLARGSNQRTLREERGCLPGPHAAADHRYYYRKDKRPVALAVHLYDWPVCEPSVAKVCDAHGLTAQEVSDFPSWWYPGETRLVVYSPLRAADRRTA